ncbi:MAG: ATP-dependent zinc metalloprotease FtsH [Candidatus Cloacimonadaceae bacterium]
MNKKSDPPDSGDKNKKPYIVNIKPRKPHHSLSFWIMMLLLAALLYQVWAGGKKQVEEVPYGNFVTLADSGRVSKATFMDRDIMFEFDNRKGHTLMPFDDPKLVDFLLSKGVSVGTQKPSAWRSVLVYLFPTILIIVFWFLLFRGMNQGQNKAFSFGKSRAKLYEGSKYRITFKDVAGVDEAKEELQEIVDFLKDPRKFQRLGGRIPRGVLLIGRPGTGKTLLAKAVSGEAGVPFFSISGSDFVEMFVGVGAARVRDLFDQAKKNAPCITFIDEIDAVGRHRGSGLGGGHDEREQTLNQLLVEMDGFEPNDSVIIIAATNRPDILDPALLRPGRFDRQVVVDLPDIKGRAEILKVHSAKVPLAKDVNLELIARGTPGFSGADLANLVNEAALIAARKNKKQIEMEDFEAAKDKLILGKEKKSRVIPEEEKRLTAYHEVGHVLTSIFQDKTEPVHKVSIIPRGFSGGATQFLLSDKSNYSKAYLEQLLVTLVGGRAAEELVFNDLTTGAGNDLERCTDIAKKMVCSWGMSDKLGPMTVGKDQGEIFLGKEILSRDIYSEETAKIVDSEIRNFVNNAHQKALDILSHNSELMDVLAKKLLEKETLGTEEIFDTIREYVTDEYRNLVEKKYQQALEMRFEYSPKQKEIKQETEAGSENKESEQTPDNTAPPVNNEGTSQPEQV